MSCQWTKGPCNPNDPYATYRRAELEELARACGVVIDRPHPKKGKKDMVELCQELTQRIGGVAAAIPELAVAIVEEKHVIAEAKKQDAEEKEKEKAKQIAEEIQDLHRIIGMVREDEPTENDLQLLSETRKRLIELMKEQQSHETARARVAAAENLARQEERKHVSGPQCSGDSLDIIMQTELKYGDPDVINIVTDEKKPNIRQCYLRDQLQEAMDAGTPLYEWSRHSPAVRTSDGREIHVDPGAPFRQRVYKLPIGSYLITEQGYNALTGGKDRDFVLKPIGTRIVGAKLHTVSAVFDQNLEVFHVMPLKKQSEASYQFTEDFHRVEGESQFPWRIAGLPAMNPRLQRQSDAIVPPIPSLVPGHESVTRRWELADGSDSFLASLKYWSPKIAHGLTLVPQDARNRPIVLESFLPMPEQGTLADQLLADKRRKAYQKYGLFIVPTDYTFGADSRHLENDVTWPLPQYWEKERTFLLRHFSNSNYLFGFAYLLHLRGRGTMEDFLNEVVPQINLPTFLAGLQGPEGPEPQIQEDAPLVPPIRSLVPGQPDITRQSQLADRSSSFVASLKYWNPKILQGLIMVPENVQNHPITLDSFDPFPYHGNVVEVSLADKRLKAYKRYGLFIVPTDDTLFDDLDDLAPPAEEQMNAFWESERAFIIRHFPNSNYLIGLLYMLLLRDRGNMATFMRQVMTQLSPGDSINLQTFMQGMVQGL